MDNKDSFRAITQAVSDAIITIDDTGTITFANDAVEDIFGHTPDELVGEPLARLIPESLAEQYTAAIQHYLETGEKRLDWSGIELPGRHKDGHEVPISISFGEFTQNGSRYFTGVVRDITARKQREQELERYEAILETIDDGVYRFDADSNVLLVNETLAQMTGYSREELIGANASLLTGEETVAEAERMQRELAAGQREVATLEVELDTADGGTLLTEARFTLFPDNDGNAGRIGVIRDITERKEREAELELFRNLIDHSNDSVLVIDPETGRFLDGNTTACRRLGYDRAELLELAVPDIDTRFPDWEAWQAHVNDVRTEGALTIEGEHQRADGTTFPAEVNVSHVALDREYMFAVARDVTERKRYEQTLTALHGASRNLLDADSKTGVSEIVLDTVVNVLDLPGVGIYLFDADTGLLEPSAASRYVTELFGDLPAFSSGDTAITWQAFADGDTVTFDDIRDTELAYTQETPLRSGIWIPLGHHGTLAIVSDEAAAFDENDRQLADLLAATAEAALDRVEREARLDERATQLARLNEMFQQLATAETKREVGNIAVEAAQETLDLPITTIKLYDQDTGRLKPCARTPEVTELVGDALLFDSKRDVPWQVFADGDPAIYGNLHTRADVPESETPLRSAIILPLSKHGVFVSGATATDEFSDTELSLANILVNNTISALDRVEREQALRDRKNTLAEKNSALERLRHINAVIRGITRELTQASTREEILHAVCDRLAAAEPYRFAWIGTHDTVTDEIIPAASAGVEEGYLDEITVTADESETGQGPTGRAVRTREPQVENDIYSEPPFEPWRQAALEREYQSSIAVPLAYRGNLYGVLNLYADQPDAFNDMEKDVLKELGETIGYALNALERKQALVSERSVELEFELHDPSEPLLGFAATNDCTFEFESIIRRGSGSFHIFFTIRGAPPDAVLRFGEQTPDIEHLTLISEGDDECLFECALTDSAFLTTLIERGGMPQTLVATGEEGHATVRVPLSADIRAFVELFEAKYSEVTLVARRERDEPIKAQHEFEMEVNQQLTERQREVIQTAYFAGFFDWPRTSTGQEIADILNVSQPTVSRHIRGGERKLFSLLFDTEE